VSPKVVTFILSIPLRPKFSEIVSLSFVFSFELMKFKEQLMAGTDCGFSTFAGFGKIDEEICFYKLKALVEGAAMASKII